MDVPARIVRTRSVRGRPGTKRLRHDDLSRTEATEINATALGQAHRRVCVCLRFARHNLTRDNSWCSTNVRTHFRVALHVTLFLRVFVTIPIGSIRRNVIFGILIRLSCHPAARIEIMAHGTHRQLTIYSNPLAAAFAFGPRHRFFSPHFDLHTRARTCMRCAR